MCPGTRLSPATQRPGCQGAPHPLTPSVWTLEGKGVLQAAGEQQQREQAEAWVLQYNFINTGVFTVHLLLVAVTI